MHRIALAIAAVLTVASVALAEHDERGCLYRCADDYQACTHACGADASCGNRCLSQARTCDAACSKH